MTPRSLAPKLAVLSLLATLAAAGGIGATDRGAATATAPAEEHLRIRKVGEDLYQVGTVLVNARERSVRCPGEVNMDEGGPIELLACTEKGKVHESVFILDALPMDLQIALILLSMEPGRNPAASYWEEDPAGRRPPGDAARIMVEWRSKKAAEEAAPLTAPAEQFLYNIETDTPLAEANWIFMGSMHHDGRFAADATGTIITTFHDPVGILELNHETVNDDIYYVVNESVCPPAGTPVELVIRRDSQPEPEDEQTGRARGASPAP